MQGLEVYRDGNWLTIFTEEGQVIDLEMPSTLDGLENGEFNAYLNGTPVKAREASGRVTTTQLDLDLIQCLDLAADIYGAQLEICVNILDNDLNLYCLVEASAQLPLNTLKCTFID